MQFTPTKDEPKKERVPFMPGTYSFEILDQIKLGQTVFNTREFVSKAGNPTFELVMRVTNPTTKEDRIVRDFLTSTFPKKLRQAANACGIYKKYESGYLAPQDFVGCKGQVELKIEESKTQKGKYFNAVKAYVIPSDAAPEADEGIGDEVPF